jgi:pilus assembly protein CpaF
VVDTVVGAVAWVEDAVRDRVRRDGIDPQADAAAVRSFARSVVEAAPPARAVPVDADDVVRRVVDAVAGFGPLQGFLDDPSVEEVWVNEPGRVFVARGGRSELTMCVLSAGEVADLVERMLRSSGRRLDRSSPFVDAALPDGSRLHVVVPDVTREHWAVNIRKFVAPVTHLDDLVALGALTRHAAGLLRAAVVSGLSIVVSGATQAGKTTVLGALLNELPSGCRLVTCEEVFELRPAVVDVVAMQTRQPNIEGSGEIPLRRLVKEALRMRPGALAVGEVRAGEALDLLVALNAGVPGIAEARCA